MSPQQGTSSTRLANIYIPSIENFKLMDQVIRSHVARYQIFLMASSRPELQERPVLILPAEVIEVITKQADFGDLKALNLVSRAFYSQASRRLFKTLNFWADERKFIVAPPLGARMRKDLDASRPLRFTKLVKAIQFWAPVVHNLRWRDRCAYHVGSQGEVEEPTYKILRLFERLEKDSLRSFDWQLTTCIPDGILSAGSCLVEEQRAIETMSLITSCCSPHKRKPYVFTNFKHMHSFSWIGILSLIDVRAVRDFLRSNRKILQHLELNFVHREEAEEDIWGLDREANVSAGVNLPRVSDNIIQEFRSLRYLSLTKISLTNSVLELASALNIGQLRSLQLHHCANTLEFLHAVATANTPLMLSSLELSVIDHIEAEWTGSAVILFLESFQGLEDLHVLINPACPALRYWQAAANHHSTLRNIAYHERTGWGDQYVGRGEYPDDPLSTGYTLSTEHQLQTLLDCSLDCLGYCDSSIGFQEWFRCHYDGLKPFTLKLLHIRRSRNDVSRDFPRFLEEGMAYGLHAYDREEWLLSEHFHLDAFVEWAFTREHLPKLQVLAFGDFAYDGRYRRSHLLFCREDRRYARSTYRLMETRDWANGTGTRQPFDLAEHEMVHFESIHRPFEFLTACPARSFLHG